MICVLRKCFCFAHSTTKSKKKNEVAESVTVTIWHGTYAIIGVVKCIEDVEGKAKEVQDLHDSKTLQPLSHHSDVVRLWQLLPSQFGGFWTIMWFQLYNGSVVAKGHHIVWKHASCLNQSHGCSDQRHHHYQTHMVKSTAKLLILHRIYINFEQKLLWKEVVA
jgi:hypothetical protein